MAKVHFEDFHSRPADRCESDQDRPPPGKVLAPVILSGVKEPCRLSRVRIDPGDVRPLVIVTRKTGQRQILRSRGTAVLFGNDVVDFVAGVGVRLRHLAIFAPRCQT